MLCQDRNRLVLCGPTGPEHVARYMVIWLIIFGLPLVIYLGLALVAPGRAARRAVLALATVIALAWLAFVLDISGFAGRDGPRGAYTLLGLTGVTTALVLGTSLQALRLRVPRNWPAWAWPLCIVITLVAIALPLTRFLNG